jgi:hypothetical protein
MTRDKTQRIDVISGIVIDMQYEGGCMIGSEWDAEEIGALKEWYSKGEDPDDHMGREAIPRDPTLNEVLVALLVQGCKLPKGLLEEAPVTGDCEGGQT